MKFFYVIISRVGKLTYSVELVFSSKIDETAIFDMLKAQRLAWNECSKVKFASVPKNSIVDLHAAFYRNFRTCQPQIPAQVVISAEQNVLSTFRSIKSNKHKISCAPLKKSLCMRMDKNSCSFKNGTFSLISLGKRVKCGFKSYAKVTEMFSKYRMCDPQLLVKEGRVFLAISFDVPEVLTPQTSACGVDLGMRMAAVTSEGKFYRDKKFNGRKRKIRFLKSQLKSKGTKSAQRHLKRIRRKERNMNRNQTHLLSNAILDGCKADVIVLENLKGLKVKKSKFQNKNAISQVPFAELRTFLQYKAPLRGKTVILINPRFTSQIDHRTGLKDGIRKGRRYYGKDGVILDSDQNAAINIAARSKLPVSLPASDWRCKGLDGQAAIMGPNVVLNPRS